MSRIFKIEASGFPDPIVYPRRKSVHSASTRCASGRKPGTSTMTWVASA